MTRTIQRRDRGLDRISAPAIRIAARFEISLSYEF